MKMEGVGTAKTYMEGNGEVGQSPPEAVKLRKRIILIKLYAILICKFLYTALKHNNKMDNTSKHIRHQKNHTTKG